MDGKTADAGEVGGGMVGHGTSGTVCCTKYNGRKHHIIKHAMVPQCGIAMEELFKSASSEGLYTNLLISGRRSTALVSDERIKGVSLTGSEAAGSSMAEAAGKYLKNQYLN
jgi:acyl-CoA reductase-like NAD-dependent aldehyde dehydrogenase